jgi:hypothetical protein
VSLFPALALALAERPHPSPGSAPRAVCARAQGWTEGLQLMKPGGKAQVRAQRERI